MAPQTPEELSAVAADGEQLSADMARRLTAATQLLAQLFQVGYYFFRGRSSCLSSEVFSGLCIKTYFVGHIMPVVHTNAPT